MGWLHIASDHSSAERGVLGGQIKLLSAAHPPFSGGRETLVGLGVVSQLHLTTKNNSYTILGSKVKEQCPAGKAKSESLCPFVQLHGG